MLASSPGKSPRLHSSPSSTSLHYRRTNNTASYQNVSSSSPRVANSRKAHNSPRATAAVALKTKDASTQYSPQELETELAGKNKQGKELSKAGESAMVQPLPITEEARRQPPDLVSGSPSVKRTSGEASLPSNENGHNKSSLKRVKAETPEDKILPVRYEFCNTGDLVAMMSTMINDIVTINDGTQMDNPHLTRFHSRVAPGISARDYLQRLATHLALQPVILLTMVFYIDRLCSMYAEFTVNSLTCHRFLITAATVATKGLSDSFWNNSTYARVGGVKLSELALLELEFLYRVDWRIIPDDGLLVSYYNGLITRTEGYALAKVSQEKQPASNGINGSPSLITRTDGLTLARPSSEKQPRSAEINGSQKSESETNGSTVAQPSERQLSSDETSGSSSTYNSLPTEKTSKAQQVETNASSHPALQPTPVADTTTTTPQTPEESATDSQPKS